MKTLTLLHVLFPQFSSSSLIGTLAIFCRLLKYLFIRGFYIKSLCGIKQFLIS